MVVKVSLTGDYNFTRHLLARLGLNFRVTTRAAPRLTSLRVSPLDRIELIVGIDTSRL